MRLIKFYIKSFVFKIIASNNYFKKLYIFYYNYTSNKRFRSKEYAKSAERIIDENIVPSIEKELNIKQNITLLDVGCGPDIFNNVYIFFKFSRRSPIFFNNFF